LRGVAGDAAVWAFVDNGCLESDGVFFGLVRARGVHGDSDWGIIGRRLGNFRAFRVLDRVCAADNADKKQKSRGRGYSNRGFQFDGDSVGANVNVGGRAVQ